MGKTTGCRTKWCVLFLTTANMPVWQASGVYFVGQVNESQEMKYEWLGEKTAPEVWFLDLVIV